MDPLEGTPKFGRSSGAQSWFPPLTCADPLSLSKAVALFGLEVLSGLRFPLPNNRSAFEICAGVMSLATGLPDDRRTSFLTSRHGIITGMAGYVVIRITERLQGGEPLRTAYAVAEANQHRAIALFKLRPDHTADERVEAVVELTQSALDVLGLKPGMIKPL